jgi:dolichol-phosphate mannosyltransferase
MLYIVIPAFNEESNLKRLVEEIAVTAVENRLQYTAIIIDDGSTDATAEIIKELSQKFNIIAMENRPNAGLGVTMAKGLAEACRLSTEEDLIVTLDGDATHDPMYFPAMKSLIEEGYDIVIASRFAPNGEERGLSAYRKFLSRGSGTVLNLMFPIDGVRDYTSGYRMFSAAIIKKGFNKFKNNFIEETGFSVTPEILLKLSSLDARIGEVGFTLKYDRKVGLSKIKIPSTVMQYVKMIARFKFKGF